MNSVKQVICIADWLQEKHGWENQKAADNYAIELLKWL